ncbi:MAG: DEAD/DEAH box helicase [Bryobacterales bacterium]|nr:DEAD/DEAH box helicase [Bryobacterales bacterium]
MNLFSELNLSSQVQSNLEKNKFSKPTPVQAEAIPPALEGRDVIATAQTGTGKTLAFALPIVERLLSTPAKPRTVRAVILSPTRELALQIRDAFALLTARTQIAATAVVGGMDEQRQLRDIRNGAQIIVATPGRLCDFLDRKLVKLGAVEVVVLDEADRMLDMGFLPSIKAILEKTPPERQTLLFSATIDKSMAKLIEEQVKDPVRIAIGATTKPAEGINLHVYEVEQDRKLALLHHLLQNDQGAFLVFTRTKHGTDRLADRLAKQGVAAARIHGGRTQGQRNTALKGFKTGTYRVLVATDVAARGIHVDDVAHVVNYDLPQMPEDFIHRAGRTGRAGAVGTASTFSNRSERSEVRRIERAMKVQMTEQPVPAGLVKEVKEARPAGEARPFKQDRPAGSSHGFRERRPSRGRW